MADTERGFQLRRTVNASREEVFRAWTDPAHMEWYLNPEQPKPDEPIEVDLRVGGQWRLMMVINPQLRYMTGGLYMEINRPKKLVFAMGATDGWPKLDPNDLTKTPIVTLYFQERDGKTDMLLDVKMPDDMSDEAASAFIDSGMRPGWNMTIDRLVARFANMGR